MSDQKVKFMEELDAWTIKFVVNPLYQAFNGPENEHLTPEIVINTVQQNVRAKVLESYRKPGNGEMRRVRAIAVEEAQPLEVPIVQQLGEQLRLIPIDAPAPAKITNLMDKGEIRFEQSIVSAASFAVRFICAVGASFLRP